MAYALCLEVGHGKPRKRHEPNLLKTVLGLKKVERCLVLFFVTHYFPRTISASAAAAEFVFSHITLKIVVLFLSNFIAKHIYDLICTWNHLWSERL